MKLIRFSEMVLKKKLIISLLLFVFMPMLLFCILFLMLTFNSELKNMERIQIKENQKSIENVELISDYSDTVYSNLLYEYYLGLFIDETASVSQYYEITQYLDDLLNRYPYYVNFVVYNDEGIKYQRGVYLDQVSNNILSGESEVQDSKWTKPHMMEISSIYESTEKKVISYSYELAKYNTEGKEVYGVLQINLDPEKMYNAVFSDSDLFNEEVFLVDDFGYVFLSSNSLTLGERIEDYNKLDVVEAKDNGIFYIQFAEKAQLCYFQSLDNTSFYILRFVSVGELIKTYLPALIVIGFLTILCLIFGLIFSKIQERHIIHPLAQISVELMKIEQGDFSIDLPKGSKDEIGALSLQVMKMSNKLENLIQENYVRTIKEQEAEMNALVTQINPHFLYNTLDSIHWMAISEENYEVSNQIEALSGMFRHILNKGKSTIRIADEIEFLKSYFLIMNKRYNDSIKLYIEIEDDDFQGLKHHLLLKLLVQPLVENCFVHGLKNKVDNGIILIRFYRMKEYLYIEVEDNGAGIDPDILELEDRETQVPKKFSALRNINERIHLYYGEQYGMQIEGKEGRGSCIVLKLPYNSVIEGGE